MSALVYGLDTEDLDGEPELYGLESRFTPRGKAYKAGPAARHELLRELFEGSAKTEKAIFCLNLQYDLVNLLGSSLLDCVIPYCGNKKLVGAKMRGAGRVKFYEIGRFLPKMNLAELGEAVGVKKLALKFSDPRRVVRDAKIARMVGERIIRVLKKLEIPLRFSPISGAVAALEDDNGAKLTPAPAIATEAGAAALYGGRTEVNFTGKWDKGELYYFDFVSAYGLAMLEDLPDYTSAYESVRPQEKMYIADCTVRVEAALPGVAALPLHIREGKHRQLIFPTGEFRGTWTNIHLELPGVEVLKYHKTTNFPVAAPFLKRLVKRILPGPNDSKITKSIKKNLYTGLSGKFAQGSDFSVFIDRKNAKPQDYWQGVSFGDWMLVDRKSKPPRSSNKVWSAFINARNSAWQYRLYESIFTAGGKVLYGDTDSGLAWLKSPILARQVCESAQIKTKYIAVREAELLSPKVYKLVTKELDPKTKRPRVILSTKGVPKRLVADSVVLGEDVVFGEIPDSFLSLLKHNSDALALKNNWRKKSWKFSSVNRNRMTSPNNPWTFPLHICNGEIKIGRSKIKVQSVEEKAEKKRVAKRPVAKSPLSSSEWQALARGVR